MSQTLPLGNIYSRRSSWVIIQGPRLVLMGPGVLVNDTMKEQSDHDQIFREGQKVWRSSVGQEGKNLNGMAIKLSNRA